MEMNFEFTDIRADRAQDQRPSAVEDISTADAARQAEVGQQLHGATDGATLNGERDHEALHQRGPTERAPAADRAEDAAAAQSAGDGVRPAVRVRYVDAMDVVSNPGPAAHPAKPAEAPDSVGFYATRHPEHVRVFYLETEGASEGAEQPRRPDAETAYGDQNGHRYEISHDGGDTAARRFVTDRAGESTVETGDVADEPKDTTRPTDEGDGATEQADEREADSEGDEKNSLTRGLSSVLRVTGRVISEASRGALDAYRQGPGERILEEQLERRAERVGNRAVKQQVRAAKSSAPFFQRQYAAHQVKYLEGTDIKRRAKQRYKDEVRASWREGDEAATNESSEQDDET